MSYTKTVYLLSGFPRGMFNVEQLKWKLNVTVGFSFPAVVLQVIFLAINKMILKAGCKETEVWG